MCLLFFFFNDTATTEIYTLSLHDALPICPDCGIRSRCGSAAGPVGPAGGHHRAPADGGRRCPGQTGRSRSPPPGRSEEHTSELQSRQYLVCRLLLEKKKTHIIYISISS